MSRALGRPPFAGLSCLADRPGPVALGQAAPRADQTFVAAADGVRLATDVYLPPGRGPFATVLCRVPYDKSGDHAWIPAVAERLVEDRYAFVAQDVRGKARSEGERAAFLHEAADGSATLDWIEQQRWSNGRVGMWGQSYYGFTQWAAAATGHRALRCIVPQVTASDIGGEWMYQQGVFRLQAMAEWGAWAWSDAHMLGFELDWQVLPAAAMAESWTGVPCPSYSSWTASGPRSRYWRRVYPTGARPGRVRAAVMSVGAFWDVFQRGQVRDWEVQAARRPRGRTRLWMAARDHFGSEWTQPSDPSPDYEYDPSLREQALDRYIGPSPEWYDAWLRREHAPRRPPVSFQVAGEGWRDADAWPPPPARPRILRLAPGRLVEGAAVRSRLDLPCDPEHPVPSLDENPWRTLFDQSDRRFAERSPYVAVFDLEPLSRPLVLAGPAAVRLPASSEAPHAHLCARLVDVWPDGPARLLAHGACTLTANRPAVVDLGHVCCRLQPAHRLRLELSATDFPRYVRAAGHSPALRAAQLSAHHLHLELGDAATLTITHLPQR